MQNHQDRREAAESKAKTALEQSSKLSMDLSLIDKNQCKVCSLEITGDCAWSVNLQTGEINFCKRFAEIHDISKSDLPNKVSEFLEYIHKDDRATVQRFLSLPWLKPENISHSIEYRFRRGNGSWCWILGRSRVVDWHNGAPSRIISINSDITERKRRECQMEIITERLRESQSLARIGDWRYDLDSGRIEWSEAVYELFERDKALGPPTFDENMKYYNPQDVKRLKTAIKRVKKTGNDISIDLEVSLPGGRKAYHASVLTAVENKDGKIVALKGIVQDVTRRKRAERERERMIVDLEDANKELERFTYTVSHDLRSPLITIQGFIGQLEQEARNGQFELLHEDIERISKSTIRMQRLLDELLELSRVGRKGEEQIRFSLAQVIRDAIEICSGRINKRKITVKIGKNIPDVKGDRSQILRVIQNLIDNAAKYMGEKPQPIIEIFMENRADQPVLCIRDNGIGIEPTDHETVFGLFDQLASDNDGTGLGLALVQRIVHSHGGRIWVESEGAGTGSTFCIILPFVNKMT